MFSRIWRVSCHIEIMIHEMSLIGRNRRLSFEYYGVDLVQYVLRSYVGHTG